MELNSSGKNKNEEQGIIFKDFVKQHLKKENELENEIRSLKEKLKTNSKPMYDRMYNLFIQMRNYIRISIDSEGFKLSIDDFPLSNEDAEFFERQIRNADEQSFLGNKFIDNTSNEENNLKSWGFKTKLYKQNQYNKLFEQGGIFN